MFSATDHRFMARALQLAERGRFTTSPNPRVGCVLVQNDTPIAEGWHERAGEPHAEAHALRQAGERARGATAYVTLEPCSHFGRTPPCADALIAAGVSRVLTATLDPNPAVSGKGLARLQEAGVQVQSGLMEQQARELNIGFFARMTRKRPWLRMKIAASLDGRTALANGVSQWITGEDARADGHRWRARSCAVLTGVGTVKDDDPQLTVRAIETTRQPIKVLVDSNLAVSPSARLFDGGPALVFCANRNGDKEAALRARGAEIHCLPNGYGKVDLLAMAQELARLEINEVLVEAGVKLNGSLLRAGVIDELLLYVAPHLLGDKARGMFDLPELTQMKDRREVVFQDVAQVGKDLRILARFI